MEKIDPFRIDNGQLCVCEEDGWRETRVFQRDGVGATREIIALHREKSKAVHAMVTSASLQETKIT